jgi:hypothetical protein
MDEFDPAGAHLLRRLPGLFRRWELGQVIEAGKDYRVEDAGTACDGTTLFAVYAAAATAENDVEAASTPADRLDTKQVLRGGPWGRPSEQRQCPDAVPPTKVAR